VHGALGVASFVPGLSVVTGSLDAAIYLAEGNAVEAGIAAVSILPGGKIATTVGKVAKGAVGLVKEAKIVTAVAKTANVGDDAVKLGNQAADKLDDAAAAAKKAKKDTTVKKKGKRKPKRRCELVPYDELECEKGQEAHHVVPDWMLRMGTRGGTDRIPEMPSLAGGPAICLEGGSGKEHNTAHKHTDRPAQRVGKSGKATGVAGTITLGQGKAISSRAVEKATGGKAAGGCDRADIQKQLDEQFKAHNDSILRGVKDARKVTDTIKDALNGGKD
jgi:hypothetical protein